MPVHHFIHMDSAKYSMGSKFKFSLLKFSRIFLFFLNIFNLWLGECVDTEVHSNIRFLASIVKVPPDPVTK